jgi:hypothetical protein
MVRTQVQLTQEQAAAVKEMAEEDGVSMAEVIRRSVEDRIRQRHRPSRAELWERARKAAGMIKGGPPDLARNHDKYLAEAYES